MMCQVSRERSTGPTSLAQINRFPIRRTLFVVRETRLAPEMSITLGAGNSDGGESARGARHTIATCLLTAVCGLTRARLVTCITNRPLRYCARYIHDHVILLSTSSYSRLILLGESTCPSIIMASHAKPR